MSYLTGETSRPNTTVKLYCGFWRTNYKKKHYKKKGILFKLRVKKAYFPKMLAP